ncbi:partial Cell shape-determining protein MreB, partial [Rhodocyclaceae bacterium]
FGRAAIKAYVDGAEGRLMRSLKSVLGSALMDETTRIKTRTYTFKDIIGLIVGRLKAAADAALDADVSQVVLGRPVHFVDDNPAADGRAQNALEAIARACGFREIAFQYEPIAAALTYEQSVREEQYALIADIGGGTTEVGVISLGGMVYAGSVRVGGDQFDEAIIGYIRRNYGMLIGETTAEAIKKEIGSAFPGSEVREMEVKGRNLAEGIPRSFTISSNEILEALTDPLNQIVGAVKIALEQTPPELGADIAEKGMVLTGGGALLRDLDRLLMEETGLPVIVADDPLTCVVRGSGLALEKMDKLGSIFANE